MTTLTRELNNPYSPLYQWFESKQSEGGNRLIKNHNEQMDRSQIIRPSGKIQDFALVGTAFVYAFRWHLRLLAQSFDETVASYNLHSNIANQLLKAKTTKEKAIACLIFAAYEQKYRSGDLHEIATVLMNPERNALKPELNYVSVMVEDLVNLIDSIPSVWNIHPLRTFMASEETSDDMSSSLRGCKYFLNPTFTGSNYINADAQQIVDDMLIKCFTTLKKSPLTKQHFWQQIAYVLMDWENEYNINKICWYYSRQKALFIYPIESLFKDLEGLRTEFRDFLTEHYDDDEYLDRFFL